MGYKRVSHLRQLWWVLKYMLRQIRKKLPGKGVARHDDHARR